MKQAIYRFCYVLLCIPIFSSSEVLNKKLNIPSACHGLGAVKEAEDILYQFYKNIDSDCFFIINPRDLENIWKVPVWDLRKSANESFEVQLKQMESKKFSNLGNKIEIRIRNEGSEFNDRKQFIEVVNRHIGKPVILSKKFPEKLPNPQSMYSPWHIVGKLWIKDKDYGVYKANYKYYWSGDYGNIYLEINGYNGLFAFNLSNYKKFDTF